MIRTAIAAAAFATVLLFPGQVRAVTSCEYAVDIMVQTAFEHGTRPAIREVVIERGQHIVLPISGVQPGHHENVAFRVNEILNMVEVVPPELLHGGAVKLLGQEICYLYQTKLPWTDPSE